MSFTDSRTEQTTAATDLVLAAVAVGCLLSLAPNRSAGPWKVGLWSWAFALLGLASALGAVVHGFQMPEETRRLLWLPLFLALGLTVALFVVGAAHDLAGERAARRLLPAMLVVGVAFFALTQLAPRAFLLFVVYEAAAMLLALVIYSRLAARGLPGGWWMVAGIVLSIAAAAVQQAARGVTVTVVWPFDHNGLFHLVQMPGLLALAAGLRAALVAAAPSGVHPAE